MDKPFQTPINLASLQKKEALQHARIAGQSFLDDSEALQPFIGEMAMKWVDANMPIADGQTDDQFSELGDALEAEFSRALSAGLQKSRAHPGYANSDPLLKRLDKLLGEKARAAWKLHNVLAFMVNALPEDTPDGLPTRCTVIDLRRDMDHLASSLSDLQDEIAAFGETSHE